jgi:hypothetical protein
MPEIYRSQASYHTAFNGIYNQRDSDKFLLQSTNFLEISIMTNLE